LYCLQVVQMLVDAGAKIEATMQAPTVPGSHPVCTHATPLVVAAAAGKLDVMQILLGEWQQFRVAASYFHLLILQTRLRGS
jgi:hypothetical protein